MFVQSAVSDVPDGDDADRADTSAAGEERGGTCNFLWAATWERASCGAVSRTEDIEEGAEAMLSYVSQLRASKAQDKQVLMEKEMAINNMLQSF
ncbi:uncharacterized protein MONOS_9151 [Monocercomonoides exilis]|uniref:uncharacterized protein n=1 Tax=Monocercomonoides exilis TaxID=2049356 RepID=UPI0035597F8D|nr:hypothetical protein MONOS_9151 [Monocercomonoides exilis]|eukprot:MONOS_9151.1-p1 / transcript=MONOS_9151.1 / gene=MONOS_9151 / organism=Monocercomonoides_exilis_PA203 / gene_product=unspecified product / transcript_product=unspecified product / location=Mono_scaffold00369:9528-9809(-) / protein_length=94 / sequence_SO=supercontig / SO=protein_coding / is_pseudo=false